MAGDQITASPINGVGMKATDSAKVVGIAQDNLAGSQDSKQSYTDKKGHKHSVLLGQVPISSMSPTTLSSQFKTLIPTALQECC